MSALTASIAPTAKVSPRVRALPRARAATPPKVSYVVATLLGIFAILAGQLMLSIALGNGAYAIQDLERQLAERNRDLSIVSEEIGAMQDPQTLASLAVSLGMVDDGDPAYLRLSDAQILGSDEPATAGSTTVVSVVPGEETTDIATVASSIVSQNVEGESLSAFAALTEDTSEVALAATNTLEGVESVIPVMAEQPAPAAKTFGGDLPSPSTH